ncbi:hypothetical protein M0D64_42455 [Paraburkholderia sp. WS6]|uniref:Uncharacterized protein n=1 Tax=Paraburkholderia madseniana TaxID=2599607 RepID=A0AAP5BLG9_9BURK|nr:hypothetical protein [Paraburkholderia madseniana]MDN7154910.1 hypothetical protein [Paraburkholderia sp. WS6]MDQ6413793.1 hypothetical protein [Paraburkholderia madseniana]
MLSRKSKFWARVGAISVVLAIATAIITGWLVFLGADQLLAVFMLPAFVFACALVAFSIVSRGALYGWFERVSGLSETTEKFVR